MGDIKGGTGTVYVVDPETGEYIPFVQITAELVMVEDRYPVEWKFVGTKPGS